MSRKKETAKAVSFSMYLAILVILHPVVDLSLSQTQDILGGIGRSLAAHNVQEVQTSGSLVQGLLITSGITKETTGVLLDQSSGLGIVLLLADDLLHGMNLLSFQNVLHDCNYTYFCKEIKY